MKKIPFGFGVQESTFKDISQVILMYLRGLYYRLYLILVLQNQTFACVLT